MIAKRDIGEELLQSVRGMKTEKRGQIHSPARFALHKLVVSHYGLPMTLPVHRCPKNLWINSHKLNENLKKEFNIN